MPVVQQVSGLVWNDLNQDGIQTNIASMNETPIQAVIVNLYKEGNTIPISTTLTNAFGEYSFLNLPVGNYIVEIASGNFEAGSTLNNFTFSPPNVADDDTVDSDFNTLGYPNQAPIIAGATTTHVDAGLYSTICSANLDVMYILDLSESMTFGYGDGTITKLDGAKQAIIETNRFIESLNNQSRVGLTSFFGGTGGQIVPAYVNNNIPYTTNFAELNATLSDLGASGTTPTGHAIRLSGKVVQAQTNGTSIPVIILITDGVPTVSDDFVTEMPPFPTEYSGYLFDDEDVQMIPLRLSYPNGPFRSIADVREDGTEYEYNGYAGEPLADAMQAINDVMELGIDNLHVHGIALQGGPGDIFNPDILQYVASVGDGIFAQPGNLNTLNSALQNAVINACPPTP